MTLDLKDIMHWKRVMSIVKKKIQSTVLLVLHYCRIGYNIGSYFLYSKMVCSKIMVKVRLNPQWGRKTWGEVTAKANT
jgi:hypothetical protein